MRATIFMRKFTSLSSSKYIFFAASLCVYTLLAYTASSGAARHLNFAVRPPVIYTFYSDGSGNHTRGWYGYDELGTGRRDSWYKYDGWNSHVERLHQEIDLIDAWKVAWFKAGWDTKILTPKDAEAHESFEEIRSMLEYFELDEDQKLRVYRWVAMAHAVPDKGGWMSELDVLPLHMDPKDGRSLPNEGKFTSHSGFEASLLSGSKDEWNTKVQHMIELLKAFKMMFAYRDLVDTMLSVPEDEFVRESDVGLGYFNDEIGGVDCSKYHDQLKAVRFSSSEYGHCVMGGWLETEMREKYGASAEIHFLLQDGTRVFRDPDTKQYGGMTLDNVGELEGTVNGTIIGNLRDVFDEYKSRTALNFMQGIHDQCIVM